MHAPGLTAAAPKELADYNSYCFGSGLRFLCVSQGLEEHATARIGFLGLDRIFALFRREKCALYEECPDKPVSFEKAISFAQTPSEGIPFARVDSCDVGGEPVFSEMTSHPCSRFMPFNSWEWGLRVGDMLSLEVAYGPIGRRDVR